MGNRRLGAVIAVLIGAVAVVGAVWLFGGWGGSSPGAAPAPPPTTTRPAQLGDGAPNWDVNRGHLQPRDITADQEAAAAAALERVRPALEAIPAARRLSADAVTSALAGLGYGPDVVSAVFRADTLTGHDRVVLGVSVGGACVSGGVWVDEVRVAVVGPVAEWGCLPPDTH